MTLVMLLHRPEKLRNLVSELESNFPAGSCQLDHRHQRNLYLFSQHQWEEYYVKQPMIPASIYQVHPSNLERRWEFAPDLWVNSNLVELKKIILPFCWWIKILYWIQFCQTEMRLNVGFLIIKFRFRKSRFTTRAIYHSSF